MLRRLFALPALLTLAAAVPAVPAYAADPDMPAGPSAYVLQLRNDEVAIAIARAEVQALQAETTPIAPIDAARHQLVLESASYRYRDSIRAEQLVVYRLAADPTLEAAVVAQLGEPVASAVAQTIEGLRALWRAAGIEDFSKVRVRINRRLSDSAPVTMLRGFYGDASGAYGVDWSYLASINFIESDFGRDNGPSSAGALGPMQFMPPTWSDYGMGGDVMNPKDSIAAAAYYLNRMGAPGNMSKAIFRYNNDYDYGDSVSRVAAALRTDPTWLDRLYYWSTSG